jgi:trehalose 6-phosphate synthase
MSTQRLVVVSNRLPVALKQAEDGSWSVIPGSGGLVTAMAPVLRQRGGTWVGWSGAAGGEEMSASLADFSKEAGYTLEPVSLTEREVREFYFGFANEIIWPLFHDFQSRCNFRPQYWHTYLNVNRKFAEAIGRASTENDFVWVHDYHLMHVAWMAKELNIDRKLAFYLHIPFPSIDIFLKLPWRDKIIRSLMEYDLVGFQTHRDRRNFLQAVKMFLPGAKARGRGPVINVTSEEHSMRIGAFPIGIDYAEFNKTAKKKSVVNKVNEFQEALRDRTIILGVDRLDYTKGVPQRLEAMRVALEQYPEMLGKVSLVQVLVPSREKVPEYQTLKEEIERLVGEINGQFTRPGYIPIHYQYRSLDRNELTAYYRAAAMALITPLRDGMNLVAKEYCACNISKTGVLFLSEFAGAAAQLQNGAILVNPYHLEGVAKAIWEAWHMDAKERRQRMRKMQETIRKYDIFWWVDAFLQAGFSTNIGDFPQESVIYHPIEGE